MFAVIDFGAPSPQNFGIGDALLHKNEILAGKEFKEFSESLVVSCHKRAESEIYTIF